MYKVDCQKVNVIGIQGMKVDEYMRLADIIMRLDEEDDSSCLYEYTYERKVHMFGVDEVSKVHMISCTEDNNPLNIWMAFNAEGDDGTGLWLVDESVLGHYFFGEEGSLYDSVRPDEKDFIESLLRQVSDILGGTYKFTYKEEE